ncbi:MAG: FtsW/RodA/SpoVE family cell cycle protein, partial [Clostridia bacterium]|nr:FtsW/RodA/SpoVE family cell cycle protein [Clostridia bacterium]
MDFERKAWRDFDGLLLVPVAGLAVIGLVVLASATQLSPGDPSTWGFVARQLLWWIGSAVVALVLAFVDYHLFRRWTRWLYGLNLALLLAVRLFGEERLGAQRWLSVGPVDLQPSEFAKVLLILTLADVLARSEDGRPSWGAFGSAAAHV